MRILLIGADGQLGSELAPLLSGRGTLEKTSLQGGEDSAALDLADGLAIEAFLNRCQPELIINAAAYTAVDNAEEQRDLALAVNGRAPGLLAEWAAEHGAGLVHFSTDYVFNGRKASPYLETDEPDPINYYGETKLSGEQAIEQSGCRQITLRTSWVYASHGMNFPLKMLELARSNKQLSIVSDQVGRPTWAGNLARYALATIDGGLLDDSEVNLVHAADAGAMSWFEFSRLIFDTAEKLGIIDQAPALREVGSDAFPTIARRPASSVLGTGLFRERLGLAPESVKSSLAHCLGELISNE